MADLKTPSVELSKDTLRRLANYEESPALTIYMPVQTPSAKATNRQENMIRLKNLLRDAGKDEDPVLAPVIASLRETHEKTGRLWDPKDRGIAIFAAPDFAEIVSLPATVREEVVSDNHFHLKPLFRPGALPTEFYLVSLDMQNVKLYSGGVRGLTEIPLGEDLKEMPDILREFNFERSLNWTPGRGADSGDVYVGYAGGDESLTPHIIEFIEGVDQAIREQVGSDDRPVILVGTDNVVGHYRRHSKLRTLAGQHVHGSAGSMKETELHTRAIEIVKGLQEKALEEELERVREGIDSRQGVHDIGSILKAAYEGRLRALLVAEDRKVLGSFDTVTEEIVYNDEGSDLLDLAACYAFRTGGRVFAVPEASLPGKGPAAALLHPE
jgi:hypothetical protein